MLYTVQVRLAEDGLVTRMSEMRVWLDSHRYQPDLFQYRMQRHGALMRVDFKIDKEAFAFAEAFGGSIQPTTNNVLLRLDNGQGDRRIGRRRSAG